MSSTIDAKLVSKSPQKEKEDKDQKQEEYALLAHDCYQTDQSNTINGWRTVEVYDNKSSGFAAKLYEKNGEYVLATAGTSPLSGHDWINNIKQQFGLKADQYEQSIALSQKLATEYPNIVFVGHSLGGGLASANSRATGKDAFIFNPSALNNRYNLGMPSNITAYISNGDVLDYVNTNLLKTSVQGEIVHVDVKSSSLPNLNGIPGTGLYQLLRGVKIHTDINPS